MPIRTHPHLLLISSWSQQCYLHFRTDVRTNQHFGLNAETCNCRNWRTIFSKQKSNADVTMLKKPPNTSQHKVESCISTRFIFYYAQSSNEYEYNYKPKVTKKQSLPSKRNRTRPRIWSSREGVHSCQYVAYESLLRHSQNKHHNTWGWSENEVSTRAKDDYGLMSSLHVCV